MVCMTAVYAASGQLADFAQAVSHAATPCLQLLETTKKLFSYALANFYS